MMLKAMALATIKLDDLASFRLDGSIVWEDQIEWLRERHLTYARAALTAIRLPTFEERRALGLPEPSDRAQWVRRIDAILSEQPE